MQPLLETLRQHSEGSPQFLILSEGLQELASSDFSGCLAFLFCHPAAFCLPDTFHLRALIVGIPSALNTIFLGLTWVTLSSQHKNCFTDTAL
jgi:hypothetical protein